MTTMGRPIDDSRLLVLDLYNYEVITQAIGEHLRDATSGSFAIDGLGIISKSISTTKSHVDGSRIARTSYSIKKIDYSEKHKFNNALKLDIDNFDVVCLAIGKHLRGMDNGTIFIAGIGYIKKYEVINNNFGDGIRTLYALRGVKNAHDMERIRKLGKYYGKKEGRGGVDIN